MTLAEILTVLPLDEDIRLLIISDGTWVAEIRPNKQDLEGIRDNAFVELVNGEYIRDRDVTKLTYDTDAGAFMVRVEL